jgi:hypothetical protein
MMTAASLCAIGRSASRRDGLRAKEWGKHILLTENRQALLPILV